MSEARLALRDVIVEKSRRMVLDVPVNERLEGSLAAAVACILNGAHLLRVHDVKETKRAAQLVDAIKRTMNPELA